MPSRAGSGGSPAAGGSDEPGGARPAGAAPGAGSPTRSSPAATPLRERKDRECKDRAGRLPVRRDQRQKAVATTLHAPGREPDNIARVPSSWRRVCRAAPARYSLLVEPAIAHDRPASWTRGLLYCGVAAGPVFVTTFLAEGATRPGYRPSRHPVSSLALGPRGRVQAANFAVTGTLFIAGAAGLWRAGGRTLSARVGQALIGAAGAGLIGAAVFPTDPVSGYPPGTPDALTQPSRTGMMHNLAAVPVFLGLPAAAFTCSWPSVRAGHRGFGLYSAASATTMLATMALAGAGLQSITPAGQSRRIVPASQHRDRLRLAHSPVRPSARAYACRHFPEHT